MANKDYCLKNFQIFSPGEWSISTKIILMVISIFTIFTMGLSAIILMTSYKNLAFVTLTELNKMSVILSRQIKQMEKDSKGVLDSLQTNSVFLDQSKQASTFGPYFAQDPSLMGLFIEDPEKIYLLKTQLSLLSIVNPIAKLNDFSEISIYLTPPFHIVKKAAPVLLERIDRKYIYLSEFFQKGKTGPPRIHFIPLNLFHTPRQDYFDISSVYSVSPEKFYKDNKLRIRKNPLKNVFFKEAGNPAETTHSRVFVRNGMPVIKTWRPIKISMANPETFTEMPVDACIVETEQSLDHEKLLTISNSLGVEIGITRNKRLLATSIAGKAEGISINQHKTLSINNKEYYYSSRPIIFKDTPSNSLACVTFSPVSILAGLTSDLFINIVLSAIMAMVLTGAFIYFAVGRIMKRPLSDLMTGVNLVSRGELSHSVHVHSGDELGRLAHAFNQMSRKLSKKTKDLNKIVDELDKARSYAKNIIDSMPSVIVSINEDGIIKAWNTEAERLTGKSFGRVKGEHVDQVMPQLSGHMSGLGEAIRKKLPVMKQKESAVIDGKVKFFDLVFYPLVTNGVDEAVLRVDDVTEKVRLEEMMIQSEKMLSVGGLAAGMAHEINNPLAGILQNIQVMQNRLKPDLPKNIEAAGECGISMEAINKYMTKRKFFAMAEAIMNSGRIAARIVGNMLSFSRQGSSRFSSHDMSDLLEKTLELAENDYDLKKKYDFRKIEIIRQYDANAPSILCEGSKIQQVFLNILKNGAHAMAQFNYGPSRPCFFLRILTEGKMFRVEIEDNGPGMVEDIRKRVFEPFFTTKEVGVGTGLGLSVSYFIITENHKGSMEVESTPGRGSKFIIKLPLKPER